MNLAIDNFSDVVISLASIATIVLVGLFFVFLGRNRIQLLPTYAATAAISFVMAVIFTKGLGEKGVPEDSSLILRALVTAFYAAIFILIYWIARAKRRPAPRKPVKKVNNKMKKFYR